MIKILFICHGNICRSPMAEFILKHLVSGAGCADQFFIASAATTYEEIGNNIYPPARRKLTERGIPFSSRQAVIMSKSDYERYDHIICMDTETLRGMRRICGGDPAHKFSMLLDWTDRKGRDVSDPWYSGDFEEAYQDIYEGCSCLLKKLLPRIK